jgi:DNA polymerase elongation subunit (family B)
LKDYQYGYVADPNGQHMTFTGKRCKKTWDFDRGDDEVFESDLPIETRILTDIYLKDDEPSEGHKLVFFDIEVSMKEGIPNRENAVNPITSIAVYDALTEEYTVMVLDTFGNKENYSTSDGTNVVFFVDETDLLLWFLDLWEGIRPTIISGWNSDHFDVPYLFNRIVQVLGYPQANRMSEIGKVKFSKYRQKYQIAGISSLDYLDLYKKFTYTQLPNYRLATVAEVELGSEWGKIEYEGTLDDLFENDLDEFIRYNKRDVEILVQLEKKMKLIELVRGICHIGHVQYEDYGYSSRFLEGTIVTYLHRKGLIVTDRAPNARQMMNQKDNEDKFAGAYVKVPMPGYYEWVYSLDLQSLYPSIIMSLNISPETKVGVVTNWDVSKSGDEVLNFFVDGEQNTFTVNQFKELLRDGNMCVSSNGVVYRQDKKGIIPEILEEWFASRVEFKKLREMHANEGDFKTADYYDKRQHIQKIFLNSLYGVLGLPIFRFFDIDNAVAVTATGQTVIKNSEIFVNNLYKKAGADPKEKSWLDMYWNHTKADAKTRKLATAPYPDENDWCVYIDTDSLYFSADPLFKNMETPIPTNQELEEFTVKLGKYMGERLNKYYDEMSKDLFNCDDHKLYIKGEVVAQSAIWIAKKRYAMLKTYDLETDTPISPGKMGVKGLDIIRSTFPEYFKRYMKSFIMDLLNNRDKEWVDDTLLKFVTELSTAQPLEVARNTAVKKIDKYFDVNNKLGEHVKGTPIHVKAALNYNKLLEHWDLNTSWHPIDEGEKIKYVLLKKNQFHLESLGFKGDEDPPKIMNFINKYIDRDALFEAELKKKLQDFYDAMGWGELPTDRNVDTGTLSLFGL